MLFFLMLIIFLSEKKNLLHNWLFVKNKKLIKAIFIFIETIHNKFLTIIKPFYTYLLQSYIHYKQYDRNDLLQWYLLFKWQLQNIKIILGTFVDIKDKNLKERKSQYTLMSLKRLKNQSKMIIYWIKIAIAKDKRTGNLEQTKGIL